MASLDPGIVVPSGTNADEELSLLSSGKSLIEGFQIFKFNPLAVIVLSGLLIIVTVVVTVLRSSQTTVIVNFLSTLMPDVFKKEKDEYPEYPIPENYPGYPESVVDNKFPDTEKPDYKSRASKRQKRSTEAPSTTVSSSSANINITNGSTTPPILSVLKSAVMGGQCFQRLLCQLGNLTSQISPYKKEMGVVLNVARSFAPVSMVDNIDVFENGAECDKFACGKLPVRK